MGQSEAEPATDQPWGFPRKSLLGCQMPQQEKWDRTAGAQLQGERSGLQTHVKMSTCSLWAPSQVVAVTSLPAPLGTHGCLAMCHQKEVLQPDTLYLPQPCSFFDEEDRLGGLEQDWEHWVVQPWRAPWKWAVM